MEDIEEAAKEDAEPEDSRRAPAVLAHQPPLRVQKRNQPTIMPLLSGFVIGQLKWLCHVVSSL